jgi:hypothetical protein
MQFTTSSILMAGLATMTAAAAVPRSDLTKFFLVVQSPDSRINSQCVSGFHTGAGTSDAVVQQCGPAPEKIFTFGNNKINFLSYGDDVQANMNAQCGGIETYDSWAPVELNVGDQGSDFVYDLNAGFTQKDTGFGFIACQWAHEGAWQLFALSSSTESTPILSNCAKVTLKQGCYNTDPGCNSSNTY